MDMIALLDRISARAAALKLSESELSMAAGSRDLIRNWRRAAREGREIQARHSSLADIAAKLGVSTAWLIEGDSSDDDNNPTQPAGFAEPIASFEFRPTPPRADDPEPIAAIRAVMGSGRIHTRNARGARRHALAFHLPGRYPCGRPFPPCEIRRSGTGLNRHRQHRKHRNRSGRRTLGDRGAGPRPAPAPPFQRAGDYPLPRRWINQKNPVSMRT